MGIEKQKWELVRRYNSVIPSVEEAMEKKN